MRPVTSSGEVARSALSATLRPRRMTSTRSLTAKTSGMRWLISTTAMPRSRNRRIRSSTSATCRTLIAAVGSSISTIFASRQARPGDRHGLALAARHRLDEIARARLRLQFVEELRRTRVHRGVVEDAQRAKAPLHLAPEEHIRRRGEIVAQGEILIDDLDSLRPRIDGLVEVLHVPAHPDLAFGGRKIARDHLDERRFAGAIVPHEADNLALFQSHVDALQGLDRSEVLGNPIKLEKRHAPSPGRGS